MTQRFSRPDRYLRRSGRLDAVITDHRIADAPPFLRGLRALFVSDVHLTDRATDADLEAFISMIASADAELLLLGGDYSDTAEGCERLFRAMRRLKPPMGCYGVLGNNDAEAWEGRQRDLRRLMSAAGCKLLVNQSVRLEYGGGSLWIGGVDEHLMGRPDASRLFPKAPDQNRYRLLISHYPCRIAPAPDLMLSGHTHGGQFNLLGITPFTVGFERVKKPRLPAMGISGLREAGGTRLLVSKGIGASRIQLRVGVQPEINRISFG